MLSESRLTKGLNRRSQTLLESTTYLQRKADSASKLGKELKRLQFGTVTSNADQTRNPRTKQEN